MKYPSFSVVYGFSIWLIATLAFRFWGDAFFLIDQTNVLLAFFLAAVPVLYFMMKWVFDRYQLKGATLLKSSVLMAIPGMILDVCCMKFHYIVFPSLQLEQVIVLGAWVLWAYVFVLIIGVLLSNKQHTI